MKMLMTAILLFFLPNSVYAMADLGISPSDIRFSSESLIAGDQVRIYAKIYNNGDEDVSGYVTFYQGSTLIDDSVVVSVPTGGNADEVYVDFVVPEGKFNILALIRGTDPTDENADNDTALTASFTPMLDDDRDGIENEQDSCPDVANADQRDTDGDGDGDLCDQDDDNDGLSDEVEEELQSDPAKTDTDGDGYSDNQDAFPNDETKFELKKQETTAVEVTQTPAFQRIVEEVAKTIQKSTETDVVDEPEDSLDENVEGEAEKATLLVSDFQISPNAVFAYSQDDWNSYTFTLLADPSEKIISIWDFGDGVTSSKQTVQHIYNRTGSFNVSLTITDETGVVRTEQTVVQVPFFHLKNRLVLTAVGVLLVLLLVGITSFIRLGRKSSGGHV
jgi:hypothetical protein